MDRSLLPLDRKPEAHVGSYWAVPHLAAPDPGPEHLGPPPAPMLLEPVVLARVSFSGALNEAAKWSGKDDLTIAAEIHISPGYMSRAMRGVWQQWAKRLVAFMRATNNRAPLQWLAHQVGCEIVLHSAREARLRQLEAEIRELRSPA